MKFFQSLKTRLMLALGMVLFAVTCILSIICYRYVSQKGTRDSSRYFVEKVDGISLQLDALIEKMDTVSSQILASRTLQEIFMDAGEEEYQDKNYFDYNALQRAMAQDVIWTFNSPKRQIEGINIFSESTYVGQRYSPSVEKIREISQQDIWKVPEGEKYVVLGPHIDEWETLDEKNVISLVRPFIATNYRFRNVGVIEVQEKYERIEEICSIAGNDGFQIVVLDINNHLIYQNSEDFQSVKNMYDILTKNNEDQMFLFSSDKGSYMAAYSTVQNAGWVVVMMQSEQDYYFELRQQLLYVFFISLTASLLIFAIFYWLINHITDPVLKLASEMEELTELKQIPELEQSSMREIQILQNSFIHLLHRLNESAEELVLSHEMELEQRIMGMQAQIDPHFLYNSLTAISAASAEEGCEKAPIMCYQLSELFRYSSSHNSQVSLENELEYITTYLNFMKWRYEDNFSYEIRKTGDISRICIAKQSLQPLVENAFTHGFSKIYPPYRLVIRCEADDNGWSFVVSDNGMGFSEDKIHEISMEIFKIDDILLENHDYNALSTKNMAILNIYVRLKLQYKEALYFEIIRDQELNGAKVLICVDYTRGKENVSGSDCG